MARRDGAFEIGSTGQLPVRQAVERKTANLLRAQAGYYALTGIWPFVDLRSFQLLTGPKASPWLVKTVGALVSVIGAALLSAERAKRVTFETMLLSVGSAAAL